MGMDLGITVAKSINMITDESNWTDHYDFDEIRNNEMFHSNTENDEFQWPTDRPIDMWYARKFYDLLDGVSELKESYKEPNVIRIKKDTLKKMIECYAFTPDYFDSFNGLPRLCELYQMYDELQANGLNLYFWNSY